jgi:sugar O-acyltransferase (sialic acid O-acetyltransferase NeuD family)
MKYYIIGNGGLSKEILILTKEIFGSTLNFMGFIDIKPEKSEVLIGKYLYPVFDEEILLSSLDYSCNMYIGVADPEKISKIKEKYKKFSFPNLVHPNVILDKNYVSLSEGNIISPGCIFTADITIGSFNIFNTRVTIGHDVKIGSCNVFQPNVQISGSVKIGDNNTFGVNSCVLQLKNIGDNNKLGASSLLMKSINSGKKYFGIPALEIKI